MGEVYLAEHSMLKRLCAIKLIHPNSQTDPQAIARFEREVRATAKLSHWNTVSIFDSRGGNNFLMDNDKIASMVATAQIPPQITSVLRGPSRSPIRPPITWKIA